MKMCRFGIIVIVLLFWSCQTRGAETELSLKIVYELLSLRIDNVIRETNNLKSETKKLESELSETKATVERIEQKIERIDANISFMASKAERFEEEISQSHLTENAKAIHDNFIRGILKKEAAILRKTLVNEKSNMKQTVLKFEKKLKDFQSDVEKNLAGMNDSMGSNIENVERFMTEHKIDVDNRLTIAENENKNRFNLTDILIQEMSVDFENKIIESDAKMKQIEVGLVGSISNVSQRLSSVNSYLTSAQRSLNGRLNSAESQLRSMASKQANYYGTSFVFAYMANAIYSGSPTFIVTCPQGEAIITISIPHLSIEEQVSTTNGVLTKQYASTLVSETSGSIASTGVFVTTNKPVTLFAGNMNTGSSDGSFILPENSLGISYVIAGHTSTKSGLDGYLVVGTSDTTRVTLNSNSGSSETITLNRLQTYYKSSSDMSGTIISASAPVFVLSGHTCANIPDNSVTYCDYIEAAIPPINALGNVHIISYMKPRSAFTLSVVAPYNQTSVRISDILGNQIEIFSLQEKNSAFRTYTDSTAISVTSDEPVLVTQYGHGSDLVLGDPSMMIVPDVSFFGHVYDFSVPTGFDEPSTLHIVISDSFPSTGLRLNGSPISPSQTISITTGQYGTFTVVYVDLVLGTYRLTHSLGNAVSFGAWLYGRTYNQEYSTNLGIRFG